MPDSPHHLADELERASADLDELIREVRAGVRSARHYDQLEELGQGVGNRVVAAFRGPSAGGGTARVVPGRRGGVWAY